jgi:hypothetical protein
MNSIVKNISKKKPDEEYKKIKDHSFKFLTFSVVAFFVGFGLCVGYYSYTLINILELSKFMAIFAVVGFLIPLKLYQKWFHFIKYEMIIFNIIGIAPLFTGIFLFLNFTFSSNPFTHQYKIEKLYFEGEENYKSVGVVLEQNFFSKERKIVELTNPTPEDIFGKKFLKVTISKGLFGYEVIKEKLLIE